MTNPPTRHDGETGSQAGAYAASEVVHEGVRYWLERSSEGRKELVAEAAEESALPAFSGRREAAGSGTRVVAPTTGENAAVLRSALP